MATIQTSIVMADNISSSLHNIVSALNMTTSAFQDVQNTAANDINTTAFDGIRERINAATIATQAFQAELENIRAPQSVPVDVTPVWTNQSNIDIFQNTGIDRLNLEMSSLNDITNDVLRSQQRIGEQALNMDLLPPNASWDINFTNQRIAELGANINALQSVDVSLMDDVSIARMNAETEALRANMNSIVNLQEDMNTAIEQGDFSRLNAGYNQLNNIAGQTEQRVRANMNAIREMNNIEWRTPQNIDIFGGDAVQRYRQEIQSANGMLERLTQTQWEIGQQAAAMLILPPQAASDLTSMGTRVQALHNQIEDMQNARIQVVGIERANSEMEQLRQQLSQALQVQEDLNNALNNMDVSAANAAYNRLNSIVDSTEREIRDNITEQARFNAELQNGTNHADGLQNKIMGMAAAYVSLQGAAKVLNLSDATASNTARLDLIVDDGGTVENLQNRIFLSAQESRSDYLAVSQTISKLGLMAGDAFTGNDEMIAFAEQMNKNFIVGGSSIQEQTSAMYQLTQAMAAGKLQGDEYRSIIENAPLLAGAIEQYMTDAGVEGTMKDWAADGLLTAEVIKNAMFSVADETNARFEQMPQTFAQVAAGIKNNAMMAFELILIRLNEIANSPAFQAFANNAIGAMVMVAGIVMLIFNLIGAVGGFVADNWPLFAPVVIGAAIAWGIYTVAVNGAKIAEMAQATWTGITTAAKVIAAGVTMALTGATVAQAAAQWGVNAALLACPLVWIIMLIIVLIGVFYGVVAAVNKFAGTSVSATGIIFGAFAWLGSVVANIFMDLLDLIFGVINALINPFINLANFIGNVFTNPVSSIIYLFQGMADGVLGILQTIASALDFVFGSSMADTVAGWRTGLKTMADNAVAEYAPNENYTKVMDNLDLSVKNTLGWEQFDNTEAFNAGYKAGENLESSFSNFDPASLFGASNIPSAEDYANSGFDYNAADLSYDPSGMASDVANINSNTSDMAGMTEEDLKYLRDIAERETINRFTTAQVQVDFGGVQNTVSSNMDLDGVVEYLNNGIREAIEITAEGVYQ